MSLRGRQFGVGVTSGRRLPDRLRRALGPRSLALAVTVAYLLVVIAGAMRHEMWRDEVRALSIATASRSLTDLIANLHNEGHPALWYVLLGAAFALFQTPLVLPVLSITIAGVAVYVFLRHAPLPWWQKLLFVAGAYPVYQYSIVCRSYGLVMLLLFGYCAVYARRMEHGLVAGVLLLLLAHTHFYALIIAITLVVAWLVDAMSAAVRGQLRGSRVQMMLGLGLALLGIVTAVWQLVPDDRSMMFTPSGVSVGQVLEAVRQAIVAPGRRLAGAFSTGPVPLTLGLWTLWLATIPKPGVWIVSFGSLVGIVTAFSVFYGGAFWHVGVAYLAVVAALWLDRLTPVAPWAARFSDRRPFREYWPWLRTALIAVMLILQVGSGVKRYARDWTMEVSSSRAFAHLLTSEPAYRDALLIAEPDGLVEALPYYTTNPIYFVRQGRLSKTVRYTTDTVLDLTMEDLLDAAALLRRSHNREVLIVLGSRITPGHAAAYSWGRQRFRCDHTSWRRFGEVTVPVAEFLHAVGDENYRVYAVR